MTTATDIKKAAKLAKQNQNDYVVYSHPTFDGKTIFGENDRLPIEGYDFPYNLEVEKYSVCYYGTAPDAQPIQNWIDSVGATEVIKGVWVFEDF